MSAFGGKARMIACALMSAFDPKRTWQSAIQLFRLNTGRSDNLGPLLREFNDKSE